MFTIKNMRDGGYEAFECESYSVRWDALDGSPRVIIPTDSETGREVRVEFNAFIMNSAGKTIDRLQARVQTEPRAGKAP